MNPTPKEANFLLHASNKALATILICCFMLCFICAKVIDYRPIIVTNVSRSLNTAYQPNTGRVTLVSISSSITSTLTLTAGQSGTISLQTSPDNITYTTVAQSTNNTTGALIVGINTVNVQAGNLICVVLPGYYYKLVSSGTSSFAALSGQETQL